MSSTRMEIDKFDGHGDYTLWKDKLLAQIDLQGLSKALEESGKPTGKVIDPGETSEDKKETEEKAEALAEKVRER